MHILGRFTESHQSLRKQWQKSQLMADQFWKRWVKECLSTLTRRTKWQGTSEPIDVGDLVLICDGNMPRNCRPKGLITFLAQMESLKPQM